MNVGILALQGDFEEHKRAFEELDVRVSLVKSGEDLEKIEALVIPGGESTTFTILLKRHNLFGKLLDFIKSKPAFGTCAGLILLAKNIENDSGAVSLGALNITVRRNAYGRQIESFEAPINLKIGDIEKEVTGVFIRAPRIVGVGEGVEVIATFEGEPVLVRQGKVLGSTFHPELTEDRTVEDIFIKIARGEL